MEQDRGGDWCGKVSGKVALLCYSHTKKAPPPSAHLKPGTCSSVRLKHNSYQHVYLTCTRLDRIVLVGCAYYACWTRSNVSHVHPSASRSPDARRILCRCSTSNRWRMQYSGRAAKVAEETATRVVAVSPVAFACLVPIMTTTAQQLYLRPESGQ
jgi:hypothetical protein